ncbi:aryl-alcohol dehydrogenase-like predicted oxidoreductase [Algoriphagus aquaeductus]|uniref:Aryl-alcohol dehydrogenase-like predicted oxidoreductase n=1 Tax=Algoriphagus aquaeductus TaxID=475299 RepID=A0A326RWH8_9BACT|nr:aldo/keto reductase [Algoriphagus aquaeductus]MBS4072312.1 aldo/keto reductase [Algoriphagus sp.]PZV85540.1 aryl-alcohol dehydrogenase-like predicted oxidoreductase [Algoriphagus aquaeductus]
MKYRTLGKTGWQVSEIGLGTWQVGGGWGKPFDLKKAELILNSALDQGINFVDTADVYDGGLSEASVGRAVRQSKNKVYVATKCGRRIQPHLNEGYTPERLRKHVEDSLSNLGLGQIDLIQLHCPPSEVYKRDEIFSLFEDLKKEGKIAEMGVSVERIDEAIGAMEYEVVSTVQVIFNLFRQKPIEQLFPLAEAKNVGLIIRVPLASGLLSGKITPSTIFQKDDHRFFNREGKAFDKGETFSGVPLENAFPALEELKGYFADDHNLAAQALRWILMFKQVGTVIPGASSVDQVEKNIRASQLPPLSPHQMQEAVRIYEKYIKQEIHPQW